jgi:hypothetical protein
MSSTDIAVGIKSICELMQSTDCNEIVMEVGLNGSANDGARFLFHIMRQCPELAAEEQEENSDDESEDEE